MSKDARMGLEKFFDILGEVIAFLAVVLFAVLIINTNFPFIPENVANVLYVAKEWVGLVLIAVVGMECIIKRNIVIRIIFYLLVLLIVVFMFFPGTYDAIINMIPKK